MLTDDLRQNGAETEGFVIVSDPLPAAADLPAASRVSSPVGLHRVLEPTGDAVTLPQAARRLDARPELWPDEVRIAVDTLNLDAASYRQLAGKHTSDGVIDGAAVACRGARHRRDPRQDAEPRHGLRRHAHRHGRRRRTAEPLGLRVGRPRGDPRLALADPAAPHRRTGPAGTGAPSRCPPRATRSSSAAASPRDFPTTSTRAWRSWSWTSAVHPRSSSGWWGSMPPATSRPPWPCWGRPASRGRCRSPPLGEPAPAVSSASCRSSGSDSLLEPTGLADAVVLADARSPLGLSAAVEAAGGPADITVVCVDVPGCEQPAILSTAQGGTIIFFSMATNFAAAALGAEGLAADVRMLVGNGYVPGPRRPRALAPARGAGRAGALRVPPRRGVRPPRRHPAPQHTEQSPTSSGIAGGGSQLLGVLPDRAAEGSTP